MSLLLWTAEQLTHPTFRNLTDSYESWAYRKGLLRQVASLESARLVERDASSPNERLYRLTEAGRLHVLGGRDPAAYWSRPWDGKWRMVLFDMPAKQSGERARLRRYLRSRGYGCLQGSVWVTPDLISNERELLAGGDINVGALLLLEARPCAGETDAEIVAGAWDFSGINRRYAEHLKVLEQFPTGSLDNGELARALLTWAADERLAWRAAVEDDPLLPKPLLPPDYLGCRGWQKRIEILRRAGRKLRTFDLPAS